ncbi:hypothetical protein ACX0K2_28245, partial [Pseudomonas extremorientalis]
LQQLRANTLDEAAPSVVITDHDVHRVRAGVAQPGVRIEALIIEAIGDGVRPGTGWTGVVLIVVTDRHSGHPWSLW